MSRLEEAKQGLEEALARLEEKAASLTPSSESLAKDEALAQSQVENQRLKAVAESLDKRLGAAIASLAIQIENQPVEAEESTADDEREEDNDLDDDRSDADLDDDDFNEDYDDDDYDEEDEFVELEYIDDENV